MPLITEKNKATSDLSFRRQQLLLVLRFIIQNSAPLQAHIWIWNVTGHITKARVTRRNKVRVPEGKTRFTQTRREKTVYSTTHKTVINWPMNYTGET